MSLWQNGRTWTPRGDLGLTLHVLGEARSAAALDDVLSTFDLTDLAVACVEALDPEARTWAELDDVRRGWLMLRALVVARPATAVVHNVCAAVRDRLDALTARLRQVALDRRTLADIETAEAQR